MNEEQDVIEPELEAPELDPQEAEQTDAASVEDDGPLVVQIGDEEPEEDVSEEEVAKAPAWVQELRKRDRDAQREKREMQRRIKELEATTAPAPDAFKLGAKPTLESCDYDESIFETALETWYQDKAKVESAQREAEEQTAKAQQAWEAKVASYQEAKKALPVADFDEAEAFIQDTFDATQQGLLIKVAKDAPTLVYALGKNPKKAAELAGIKDYADFVAEAVRLEMSVKTTRKPATAPERSVSVPTGTGVASTDNHLDRLRADAEKTGDYSKVIAYKKGKQA